MNVAFLGFTFLIAAFFPVGGEIAQLLLRGIFGGVLKGTPPIFLHLLLLVLTYLPAALVTSWFFRTSKLLSRVPSTVPGAGFFIVGIVLTVVYLAARLLASTVEGGGGSFVVMQFGPFMLWPARALLAIGAVKLLLAATPFNISLGTDTQQQDAAARRELRAGQL